MRTAKPLSVTATATHSPPAQIPTVAEAVELFVARKIRMGAWSQGTIERTGGDLRRFAAQSPRRAISAVDAACMDRYLHSMTPLALASRRSRWHAVVEFLGWCVRRGWLAQHPRDAMDMDELPWYGARNRRKVGRGKLMLANAAEAIAYLEACNKLADPRLRVAAALPLLTGMRSGELRHLRVGDVDFELSRIWIRDVSAEAGAPAVWSVKTAASQRTVALSAEVREDLRGMCSDGKPGTPLFRSPINVFYEDRWLSKLVKVVCELAHVTVVSAHGLRDTFATLQVELARATAADVGALLGHGDGGAVAKHSYIGAPVHDAGLVLIRGEGVKRLGRPAAPLLRVIDGGLS
jgi:integrase